MSSARFGLRGRSSGAWRIGVGTAGLLGAAAYGTRRHRAKSEISDNNQFLSGDDNYASSYELSKYGITNWEKARNHPTTKPYVDKNGVQWADNGGDLFIRRPGEGSQWAGKAPDVLSYPKGTYS